MNRTDIHRTDLRQTDSSIASQGGLIAGAQQVIEHYQHPTFDPSMEAWSALLINQPDGDMPFYVVEIAQLREDDAAKAAYDAYIAALRPAVKRARGEVMKVGDILMPGTGDLMTYVGYSGGTAIITRYPARKAYVHVLLDESVRAAQAQRRAALAEVQWLVTGKDTMPRAARLLFGKEQPARNFRTPHVDGRSPQEIIEALLQVYPDGGPDPSRAQLEQMVHFAGFADEPVYFINLYAFDAAHVEQDNQNHLAYNQGALPSVRAHGAHPYFRAPVKHMLVGTIPWSLMVFVRWPSLRVFTDLRLEPKYIEAQKFRVASAQVYGNFVTLARHEP